MAQDDISTRAEIINQLDQKGDPYFNRFDSTQDRTALLFVYDRQLQNAELNELQAIQSYYLGALGNIVAKDGDMQQGMGYVQDGNNITVKDGLVYLAGKVRNFKQQTVSITGKGREAVGVRLVQSKVTYNDDSSLLGIAPDQLSTNKPGADRLVETVELVANDSASAPIYQFNDGKLYLSNPNSQLSKINDIVAEHDFNSLGSYALGSNSSTGFQMSVGKNISDKVGMATANIAAGKAYVQGYLVDKPYASQIDIRQALDTEQIKNEQHIYNTGTDSYELSIGNVKSIDLVTAQVQDNISVQHGVSGGSDFIVDNLVTVDSVYSESGGSGGAKVYQQGKDYNVQGNSIIWNGSSGSQPDVGHAYMVKATYNKVLHESGIDYNAVISTDVDGVAKIDFSKASGTGSQKPSKPKDNGYITVTYTAYLYRTDLITLDKNGNFTVHEGMPARKYIVEPPVVNDPLTLTIGTITMYPNSTQGECDTTVDTNLTFRELNLLKRRLIRSEYNEALNSLNAQELQKHNPTSLRGIYTDSFIDDVKFNDTYETSSNVTEPFKAAINMDTVGQLITLPYTQQTPTQLLFNSSDSAAQMLSTQGHLLSAAFTEEPMIEQDVVTSTIGVNNLNVAEFEGILTLSPNADSWTEQKVISKHINSAVNTNYWDRHGGFGDYGWHQYAQDTREDISYKDLGQTDIDYMRSIDVKFSVVGLAPYADNLELYFAGVKCDIKPDTGYSTGSSVKGSIMALSDGSAKGTFTIPANTVKCGKVKVEIVSAHNTANTSFMSAGKYNNVEEVITPVHETHYSYDPVAESFVATMDAQITSVDLKFASKSNSIGVRVELREMSSSGYPTKNVKASAYLAPSDVKVSSDGSVWTNVAFDDPITIAKGETLAVSIVSSSNDYSLWQAKLTERIYGTTNVIYGSELYSAGVMFESSNNATWTADQTSDIAFRVNVAHYSTEPCVALFDPMKNVKADEFSLLATYLTPANTGCTWEYRAVYADQTEKLEDKPWLPITTGILNDAGGIIAQIQLRATFKANRYISPLLSLSSLVFGTYLSALRGDYVTLSVDSSDSPFNHIYLSYIENTPGGSKVVPQYSLDEGHTWVDFLSTPTNKIVDGYGSKQVSYNEVLSGNPAKKIMFHLKLTTTNESQRPTVSQFMASWTQE